MHCASKRGLSMVCPLIRTPRQPVVDWTDSPADLNGLVHFSERPNLVSARVPSLFKRALPLRLMGTKVFTSRHEIYRSKYKNGATGIHVELKNGWNYTCALPFAFTSWTGTTVPYFYLVTGCLQLGQHNWAVERNITLSRRPIQIFTAQSNEDSHVPASPSQTNKTDLFLITILCRLSAFHVYCLRLRYSNRVPHNPWVSTGDYRRSLKHNEMINIILTF